MTVNVSIFYQSSVVTLSNDYYNNTRDPFCMNTALLPLRAILHLIKIQNVTRREYICTLNMTVNMSILYQNSDLTQSKVYYSNTRHQFCIN